MKSQQVKSVAQQITTAYQGPIPPAIEMERYASINPDFPNRILAMAERQQAHRIDTENQIVTAQIRQKKLGMHYAFTISLIIIVGGVICVLRGHNIQGLALIITQLIGMCGVFIYAEKNIEKS